MNLSTPAKKIAIVGIVILAVVGGVRYWGTDTSVKQKQPISPGDTSSLKMVVGRNAININEQRVGTWATVSFVLVEKKGYVIVRELENGRPGDIIGISALISAGESSRIVVALSKALEDSGTYAAILYEDDGNEVFDSVSDMPVTSDDGSEIMMEFQASTNANSGEEMSI